MRKLAVGALFPLLVCIQSLETFSDYGSIVPRRSERCYNQRVVSGEGEEYEMKVWERKEGEGEVKIRGRKRDVSKFKYCPIV